MTIQEEIEQLEIKLEQAESGEDKAEIIVQILQRHHSAASVDGLPFIERLTLLSDMLNSTLYKAWALFYTSGINLHKRNFQNALDLINQSLQFFEPLNHKKGIAACYNILGRIYVNMSNYNEGLANYYKSLKLRQAIEDKVGIGDSFLNIGNIYELQGNYPLALKNFLSALKLRREVGEKNALAGTLFHTGNIFQSLGDYQEALKYHGEALKINEETGNERWRAYNLGAISTTYLLLGRYEEALEHLFATQSIINESDARGEFAISLLKIGNVYEKQGRYTEAINSYKKALSSVQKYNEKHGIATVMLNLGGVYLLTHEYEMALQHLFSAIPLLEEAGDKDSIKISYRNLAEIYKATNDYKNALFYFEKYQQLEAEMTGIHAQSQLTNLNFIHNMEQKEKDLEIEQLRNVELKKERDRSEKLLLNILPAEVAEELKEKGIAAAKHFDEVTVLFTDFKGFTTISEQLTPQQLVDELHACFSGFDTIIHRYNIEKIKTVGDAYIAVSGLPLANINHAENIVNAAIEIREFMLKRKKKHRDKTFEVRIGIHSGSVVAGIVGIKKFAYDIWGDTVNTSARMEQNSEAGKINISQTTYELVKDKFLCEYRGEIEAKNKGMLKMYFVV